MKKTLFAAAFALVASANAAAVDDTWYGKVSYGVTDLDTEEFERGLCSVDLCYDFGTDKGFGLDVGYRLNNYFAVEGGYRDLGEASDTQAVNAGDLDPSLPDQEVDTSMSFSTTSWTMAALATTDANQALSVGGKLGFHFWETEVDVSAPGVSVNALSEDGTDIFYGVFANWRDRNWALGVEYTIFQTEIGGERIDPNMASVSLSMDF